MKFSFLLVLLFCFIITPVVGQKISYYGALNYTQLHNNDQFSIDTRYNNEVGYTLGMQFSSKFSKATTRLQLSKVGYSFDTGPAYFTPAVIDADIYRLELHSGFYAHKIYKGAIEVGTSISYLLSDRSSGIISNCNFGGCVDEDINFINFRVFQKFLFGTYVHFYQDFPFTGNFDFRLGYTYNYNLTRSITNIGLGIREFRHYFSLGIVQQL